MTNQDKARRTYAIVPMAQTRGGPGSAGQSGDTQGLPGVAAAGSESVQELVEEGQYEEAEFLLGVETAGDSGNAEVKARGDLEDDGAPALTSPAGDGPAAEIDPLEPAKANGSMTPRELSQFRTLLLDLQSEAGGVPSSREELPMDGVSAEGDRVPCANARGYATDVQECRSSQMSEVEDALGRLDNGSFGICEACEGRIHPKRLAAVPAARLCGACQGAEDRLQMADGSGDEVPIPAAE